VDAAGNITYSTTSGQVGDEFGFQHKTVPAYFHGTFRCEDLTGLDANAITKLSGNLISGGVAAGLVTF
jgi:hypothetical protein